MKNRAQIFTFPHGFAKLVDILFFAILCLILISPPSFCILEMREGGGGGEVIGSKGDFAC